MIKIVGSRRTRRVGLMLTALLVCALGVSLPVQAVPLLTGSVTVTEHEPPFSDLVDTVTIVVGANTAEIKQGDATNIGGGLLLDGEFIDIASSFGQNTILFSVRGTGNQNTGGHPSGFFDTGYTSSAEYLFQGFDFSSPGLITNVSASSPDTHVSDLASLSISFTDNAITLNHFSALGVFGSSTNLGELLLTITTQDVTTPPPGVPEPGSLALLGIGLAAAAWGKRRKKR